MEETVARKLQRIGRAFGLTYPFFSFEEICNGNVNRTYKVNYITDDGTGMAVIKPYLFQKINSYAFKNAEELMSNIERVTDYIHAQRPDSVCLSFLHTEAEGVRRTYLTEGADFWRIYEYVQAVTFNQCDDTAIIRGAGEAFGDFQNVLSGFDATRLYYTIPDFHDTRKRYAALIRDIEKDPVRRAGECREEIEYLLSAQDKACRLTDLYNEGKLPLRVTHNDTKINNVLFDETTLAPLVVIDLDTVMPGLMGHDFGDAVRFAANFAAEDAEDTSKTGVDLNVFWAFADGFLKKTACTLTAEEEKTLALSCFAITCELSTRFLDDYLMGDKYFKTAYPKHNLVRARSQIALAKDMEKKLDAMQAIVESCVNKYKNA